HWRRRLPAAGADSPPEAARGAGPRRAPPRRRPRPRHPAPPRPAGRPPLRRRPPPAPPGGADGPRGPARRRRRTLRRRLATLAGLVALDQPRRLELVQVVNQRRPLAAVSANVVDELAHAVARIDALVDVAVRLRQGVPHPALRQRQPARDGIAVQLLPDERLR